MNRISGFTRVALFISFLLAVAGLCLAQQQQPLVVQKIKGNIYMIKGGNGANTGFYVGDNEVLVIDSKMTAESTKEVIQEIGKITPKPITRIVLTHGDPDHVNGLNGFPAGLKIYAHPMAKRDMEEASKEQNAQQLRGFLPNETCKPAASKEPAMTIPVGAATVQLYYFGPAHTSGDLVVYFPANKVAFVGDLVFVGRDPLIHRVKGGSSAGVLEAQKSMLALDVETYVSGHSDPLSKKDIQVVCSLLSEKRDKVKAMIAEGKSLDEIKKAFGVKEPAQPGRMSFMSFAEVVYLDLTEKK